MPHPDLPASVKQMLADERVRSHHHLWHFVRNRRAWSELPDASKQQLRDQGWEAPRFDDERGAGTDFLWMHREMIQMVDDALAQAGDASWPSVSGWDPIPFAADDPDWPVPAWQTAAPSWASAEQWERFTRNAQWARSDATVEGMQQMAARLRDPEQLRRLSLDALGTLLEDGIHGWMHIRWSGAPPTDDAFATEPGNDWLFFPWSSHVSPVFWKLHGWIDETIDAWEQATGRTADFSTGWSGPRGSLPHHGGHHGLGHHAADPELLSLLPPLPERPMPMALRRPLPEASQPLRRFGTPRDGEPLGPGAVVEPLVDVDLHVRYDPLGHDMVVEAVVRARDDDALLQVFLDASRDGLWIPELHPRLRSGVEVEAKDGVRELKVALIDSKARPDDPGSTWIVTAYGWVMRGDEPAPFEVDTRFVWPVEG